MKYGIRATFVAIALLMVLLTFGFGCLSLKEDSKTEFKDDGSARLVLTEYAGLSKAATDALKSSMSGLGADSSSPSSIVSQVTFDYLSSKERADDSCKLLRKVSSVESCVANDDGSTTLTISKIPDGFYSISKNMDWVNLKETKTYTILKSPFGGYFAAEVSNNPNDVSLASSEGLVNYFMSHKESYFTNFSACSGSFDFGCALSGNNLELSSKKFDKIKVESLGCSNKPSKSFFFVKKDEVIAHSQKVIAVDKELSYKETLSEQYSCPDGTKTLFITYLGLEGFDKDQESVDVVTISSKDEVADEVIANLKNGSTSSTGTTTTTSTDFLKNSKETSLVDFENKKIYGKPVSEIADSFSKSSGMGGAAVSFDFKYVVSVPDKIVKARSGDSSLDTSEKSLTMDFERLKGTSGALTIMTEKELSPLGVATWLIPIVIVGGLVFSMVKK